jgi:hypothetical protein
MWKGPFVACFKKSFLNFATRLGKTTKNIHQDNRCSDPVSKPEPPEYETAAFGEPVFILNYRKKWYSYGSAALDVGFLFLCAHRHAF